MKLPLSLLLRALPLLRARPLRCLAGAVLAVAVAGCSGLVFHPLRPHVFDPSSRGIVHEDRWVRTDDGLELHGWWLPAQFSGDPGAAAAKGTVIFAHGNAENISTHIASVHWLPASGFNVYLYDYRGFGKSGGTLDYRRSLDDLRRVIRTVATYPEASGRPLHFYGQSLGGAIAVSSLGYHPDRLALSGIVIEGAPSSLRGAARDVLGAFWLTWPFQVPLSWLIDNDRNPREQIAGLAPVPLLIAHSRDDRVVPVRHGHVLRDAAGGRAEWMELSGPHITGFRDPDARRHLVDFLIRSGSQRPSSPSP